MEIAPNFFKFILLPSRDLRKLSITTTFAKENGSSFLDHAYLRAPRGLEHKVDLKKRGDNVWFSKGWKEFAENYSLAFGHFLVFYYQGNSRFDVHIYDESACEIDYLNFDTQSSVDDEDEDEDEDDDSNEEQSSDEEEEEDDDSNEEQSMDNVDLGRGKVVMSKAFIHAEAFQCDNPNFIVAMNKSYLELSYHMRVPLLHAHTYLEGAAEAVLQVGANPKVEAWTVNVTRGSSYVTFAAGWRGFVRANRLEVDDVCKFELIDRGTHTYRVHIFRRD